MSDAEIIDRLDRIEAALPVPEYLGVSFIAAKYGVSKSYMHAHKPALPNHGVSDIPGKLLWHRDLIATWVKVPIRDRINQFEMLDQRSQELIVRQWGK